MQWSRYAYLTGMVLALVLVIPTAWFPFQLAKVTAFALCALLAAVLFVWGGGARGLLRSHGLWGALLVALLPAVYVLSMLFSVDRSVALTGYAVEVDTVLFTATAFVAFIFAFVHFRTLRTARLLLGVLFWALVAAAVFQFVSILFGPSAIPFATFADRSVNLVGKWNDLGLLVGLLVLLVMVRTELSDVARIPRILYWCLGAALLALLVIINFSLVWILLLAAAFVVGLVSFLTVRHIPVIPLIVAGVAVLLLVYGSALNTSITNIFPVSSLEVRPSYQSTVDVINAARAGSAETLLVGTGPNTFGEEWLLHKPAGVNQSQFWNLDFNVGYSTLETAFGSVGLLGALAWLLPLVLLVVALLRAMRLSLLTREDRGTAVAIAGAAILLWAAIILYVPSANLVVLAFALAGGAFGFLWRQGQSAAGEQEPTRIALGGALILSLVLVGVSAWSAAATTRRAIAESLVGQGAVALQAGDTAAALATAGRAIAVEKTADTVRFALTANATDLNVLAQSTTTPTTELQQQFTTVVQNTISLAQQAQALNPKDYRPTLALAQVYDLLAGLKVQGADVQARSTYDAAAALDPSNPQIPLLRARFEAQEGQGSEVQKQIQQALTLKPNYTDAMLLVTQLAVANNDLNTAVQATQAAVQTAPGVPSLWFELGLLLYTGHDTKDAITALGQAIALQPDYANAQYFLGLSYYAQGEHDQAIQQFERLAVTNPDNAEVKLILSNMQSGAADPFAGEQPPAGPPQQRTTAPVSQ